MTVPKVNEVEAGGGVLFRWNPDLEVMLIYHRKIWDLPKGHRELGESMAFCAAREVSEEVGIPIPVILGDIGQTIHEYKLHGQLIRKYTSWYAMFTQSTRFIPQEKENITKVKWFLLEEAKERVGYENLRELLLSFEDWLKSFVSYSR